MIGLKENVLIGKLIPAGTGMKRYRNVKLDTELQTINFNDEDLEFSELDEDVENTEDAEAVETVEENAEDTVDVTEE